MQHGKDMTADMLHDQVLEATGSKAAAESAYLAKLKAQLRSGGEVG